MVNNVDVDADAVGVVVVAAAVTGRLKVKLGVAFEVVVVAFEDCGSFTFVGIEKVCRAKLKPFAVIAVDDVAVDGVGALNLKFSLKLMPVITLEADVVVVVVVVVVVIVDLLLASPVDADKENVTFDFPFASLLATPLSSAFFSLFLNF